MNLKAERTVSLHVVFTYEVGRIHYSILAFPYCLSGSYTGESLTFLFLSEWIRENRFIPEWLCFIKESYN